MARTARYEMLWACGLADLIRRDFYGLLAVPPDMHGALLDAGCGGGADALAFHRASPSLQVYGVDVSDCRGACGKCRRDRRRSTYGACAGVSTRCPTA
jgi:ubiquinone/menaquinone biosynthesis C-methylase UbiE